MIALPPLLELRAVTCARAGVAELRELSVSFAPATFNVLLGDASSGLLLRVAGLLENPDAGEVRIGERSISVLPEQERATFRSAQFGFVFSSPYLLPAMSVVENVAVPLFKIAHAGLDVARERTCEMLDFTGLREVERVNAAELSWSQQQRVALARALVHRPLFLIVEQADAALGSDEAAHFLELLRAVPERFGATVLATSTRPFAVGEMDRVLTVRGGTLYEDSPASAAGETGAS